jgi:hypothetical protein
MRLQIDNIPRWGWCDKDMILFHACFQCLVDFVEKEKPETLVDWEGTGPEALAAWEEMLACYGWYKHVRKDPWVNDSYDIDQDWLERLIKVRAFMWS